MQNQLNTLKIHQDSHHISFSEERTDIWNFKCVFQRNSKQQLFNSAEAQRKGNFPYQCAVLAKLTLAVAIMKVYIQHTMNS